jgi:hypothetical protein
VTTDPGRRLLKVTVPCAKAASALTSHAETRILFFIVPMIFPTPRASGPVSETSGRVNHIHEPFHLLDIDLLFISIT